MNTCVFIIGTNGAGKSSVARALIASFGGIRETRGDVTIAGAAWFAGKYEGCAYGGCDWLNGTAKLPALASACFKDGNGLFICEGSYLDTFGPNLVNTIFQAEKRVVVFLYAATKTLAERIAQRSGGGLLSK